MVSCIYFTWSNFYQWHIFRAKNIRQKSSDIGHNIKQELSIITETITSSEITQMAQNSPVFEFLKDEPDLYTLEDGEAI